MIRRLQHGAALCALIAVVWGCASRPTQHGYTLHSRLESSQVVDRPLAVHLAARSNSDRCTRPF